MYVIVSVYFVG